MIELKSVPHYTIDHVWPEMEEFVADVIAESRGTLSLEGIKESIRERDMQALVAVDERDEVIGVAITEIRIEMSGLRVFNIVALAGHRFDEWKEEGDRILRQWARSVEAPVVELSGRRGWVRKLANLGWKEEAVVMRLDLRN